MFVWIVLGSTALFVLALFVAHFFKAWQKDVCNECGGDLEWDNYVQRWTCEECGWKSERVA